MISSMSSAHCVQLINLVIAAKEKEQRDAALASALEDADVRSIVALSQSCAPFVDAFVRRKPNNLRPSQVDFNVSGLKRRVDALLMSTTDRSVVISRLTGLMNGAHDSVVDVIHGMIIGKVKLQENQPEPPKENEVTAVPEPMKGRNKRGRKDNER